MVFEFHEVYGNDDAGRTDNFDDEDVETFPYEKNVIVAKTH
jgi:hypothetical protein